MITPTKCEMSSHCSAPLGGLNRHGAKSGKLVRWSVVMAMAVVAITFLTNGLGQTVSYTVSEVQGATLLGHLNNLGDVVGRASDPATGEGRATAWNHGDLRRRVLGKLTEGDYSSASGINDGGQIIGEGNIANAVVPFLWMSGSGFRRIPLLPGDQCGQAQAINRQGHVAGYSSGPNGKRAFLWRRGNDVHELGVLPGGDHCNAADINDADQIVGTSGSPSGDHAVLWMSSGEVIDLGTLPGDTSSEASAINNNEVVVGYSKGSQGMRAFLWTRASGMQNLGVLAGGTSSRALAINDMDAVVGTSTSSSGDRAFVWNRRGGIRDLNSEAAVPFGVLLLEAHAINSRGQILVTGMNSHQHGIPEDSSLCAPAPPSSFLLTPK